jgi:probable rRNA maturation factor
VSVVATGGSSASPRALAAWLARIAPRSARGTVAIGIVPDSKIRALNRTYRGVDKVTDVLSFPWQSGAESRRRLTQSRPPHLGDIVIAEGMARKQAKNLGHSLGIELRVLALHGLLHLLGYDHEVDNGRMARTEARLRRKAGLPAGLIARSS